MSGWLGERFASLKLTLKSPDRHFHRLEALEALSLGIPGKYKLWVAIEMVANTGTYIDSPFHRYADGNDLSELTLPRLAQLEGVVVRRRIDEGRGLIVVGVSLATKVRDDVTQAFGEPRALVTGWDGTFALPADRRQLGFWAFDTERVSAYPLCTRSGAVSGLEDDRSLNTGGQVEDNARARSKGARGFARRAKPTFITFPSTVLDTAVLPVCEPQAPAWRVYVAESASGSSESRTTEEASQIAAACRAGAGSRGARAFCGVAWFRVRAGRRARDDGAGAA